MANRFWVGGTGTWSASSTTHWSATSGGAAGASAPGASDAVIFDANSGGGTVTMSGVTLLCASLNMEAAATMTLAGSTFLAMGGACTLGANVTYSNTGILSIGTGNLTTNGASLTGECRVGNGATVTLVGNLVTAAALNAANGSFNANNNNITCASFTASGTLTRTITMGTGIWTLTGTGTVWNTSTSTNLTLNKNTSTIKLTNASSSARTVTCNSVEINDLDIEAGSGTLTLTNVVCAALDFTGFSGAWANNTITVKGSLTFASGMSITAGSGTLTLGGTSGTQTITSNGKTLERPVTIDAAGATKQLGDALALGSTRALTLTAGTFDANDFAVTCGSFASSNANTRVLSMGSGLWTIEGTGTAWDFGTVTGLTLNAETSTVKFTAAGATERTFAGGGKTYNSFWHAPGAGSATLVITGANTFADFKDDGSAAHEITFPAGATQTVSSFSVSGNSGQLISLRSSSDGDQFTLSDGSGTNARNYLDIQDSNATGGATWEAGANSINGGNNDGWDFPGTLLAADAGSYAVTGSAAALKIARKVVAAAGSYAVNGTAASPEHGREVAADAGSYAVSGADAALELFVGEVLFADGGSYAVTGGNASLRYGREVAADAGVYAVNGATAMLREGAALPGGAEAGAYAVNGNAATFTTLRRVIAESGIYAVNGFDVEFVRSATAVPSERSVAVIAEDRTVRVLPSGHNAPVLAEDRTVSARS